MKRPTSVKITESDEKKVKQMEADMVALMEDPLELIRNQELTQGERVNKLSAILAEKSWPNLGKAFLEAALNDDHECVFYLYQHQNDLINYKDEETGISILAIAFVLGSLCCVALEFSISLVQFFDPILSQGS